MRTLLPSSIGIQSEVCRYLFSTTAVLSERSRSGDIARGLLTAKDPGATKDTVFTLDRSTRVWKGRAAGELEDLAPEQIVQCSFTWAPDWQNGQMHLADVWLDDEARALATERQRRIHVRHQQHHWLAGWVDHVEHEPGGSGIVTLTLFGSMDAALYQDVRKAKNFAVAAAEPTLRTWWQNHDRKDGDLVEMKDLPAPPPGSSGLQLRLKFRELLEGYRPGAIIRLRPPNWPNVKLPPEERIQDMSRALIGLTRNSEALMSHSARFDTMARIGMFTCSGNTFVSATAVFDCVRVNE